MPDPRTRTITWQDPAVYATALDQTALEMFRAIMRGELPPPPAALLLGMRMLEAERGRVIFEMPVAEYHYSPLNIVHGGMTASLLDTVLGCAVASALDLGLSYATTDLHVHFVRPVTIESGVLRAEGKVVHAGTRVATAEGTVLDARGKLVAHGSCTCMVLSQQRSG